MDKMMMVLAVAAMVVVAAAGVADGQGTTLCNMNRDDLKECKPAITPPNPTSPTAACCGAIHGADLACMCSYKNSNMLPYLGIDPDLAMRLPGECGLSLPSTC